MPPFEREDSPREYLGVRERLRLTEPPEEVFDALADLFLGDGALGAKVQGPARNTERNEAVPVDGALREAGHERALMDDALEEPPAVIASIGRAGRVPEESRESDGGVEPEVVDTADAPVHASPASSTPAAYEGRALVECVVLGHLPVMAAAWVGQYARHRSIELDGTVGLVRVWRDDGDSTMVSIDLVDETRDHAERGDLEDSRDVLGAIRRLSPEVRLWIVRAGELDEPTLAGRRDVDRVTLLTGADEAAMVASYRALKRLTPEAEAGPVEPAAEGSERLGVALMGGDPERAQAAIARLERVAASFLGEGLRSTVCGKISARGPAQNAGRGACAGGVDELLATLRAASEDAARDDAPRTEAMVEADRGVVGFVEPPASIGREAPEERKPLAIARGWIEDAAEQEEASSNVPKVVVTPAGRDAGADFGDREATGHPGHAGHGALEATSGVRASQGVTELLGLTALEARCPYAPAIELAIDGRRMLHLIACDAMTPDRTGGGRMGEAAERDATRCVRELVEAAAWAGAHAGLLGLSLGQGLASGEAVLHLVTREPRRVRRMLDAPVKVHALVECGGERVAIELN
jgi:hypothetical protein